MTTLTRTLVGAAGIAILGGSVLLGGTAANAASTPTNPELYNGSAGTGTFDYALTGNGYYFSLKAPAGVDIQRPTTGYSCYTNAAMTTPAVAGTWYSNATIYCGSLTTYGSFNGTYKIPARLSASTAPGTVLTGGLGTYKPQTGSTTTQNFTATVVAAPVTIASPASNSTVSDGATVTGAGEPDSTITLTDNHGTTVGTTKVASNGAWSTPATGLTGGASTITATQHYDGTADRTTSVNVNVKPTSPTFSGVDNASGSTVVNGTGQPGATVTVKDPSGKTIGTGTVGTDGSYTVTLDKDYTGSTGDFTIVQTIAGVDSDTITVNGASMPVINPGIAAGALGVALLAGAGVFFRRRLA